MSGGSCGEDKKKRIDEGEEGHYDRRRRESEEELDRVAEQMFARDEDDENEDDESIPFTIYRRDMERLENAQNLVTRKEIKYVVFERLCSSVCVRALVFERLCSRILIVSLSHVIHKSLEH